MEAKLDITDASEQIDALIEKRAREAEAANREASAEAESLERYDLRCAAQVRQARAAYHRHLIFVFEAQVQRHRDELGRLIDSAAG